MAFYMGSEFHHDHDSCIFMIKGAFVRAPEGHRDPVRGIRGEKIELARTEASADSPRKSIRENFISFLIF